MYEAYRIQRLVSGIIMLAIIILMIVPIYILYHLVSAIGNAQAYATCIGVLLLATFAFSAVLSLFTSARRHEILAAAAT